MNEYPSPNSFKKDGISSSINLCNIFSVIDSLSMLYLFLITIGFFIKSLTTVSSLLINFNLVLSSSL